LLKTLAASGRVLIAPISKRVQPIDRRWFRLNRSESSSPTPAPSSTRVPAISPISGRISSVESRQRDKVGLKVVKNDDREVFYENVSEKRSGARRKEATAPPANGYF